MNTVDREARLFRAGDYPDKRFAATPDDLDAIVAATAGGPVNLDLHHADTDETLPMGGLVPGTLRREGEWLFGTIRLPEPIDTSLRHRGLSVVIDRTTKALRKITVTPRPRVPGAAFEADGSGDLLITFDGGEIMPDEITTTAAGGASADGVLTEEKAEGLVARVLRKLLGGEQAEAPPQFDTSEIEARLTAEFEKRLAEREAKFNDALAAQAKERDKARADSIGQRIADEVSRGVPPAIANLAVPFAQGATEAKFADDKGEEQTADAASFANTVLEHFRGVVNFTSGLPHRDSRGDLGFEAEVLMSAGDLPADPVERRKKLLETAAAIAAKEATDHA